MITVIFEVSTTSERVGEYLDIAAALRPLLEEIDGFISVERFQSLQTPSKYLSLSFWRDEAAVARWRTLEAHRTAQRSGREGIFDDYRLRVASVVRDYGMFDRDEVPADRDILATETTAEATSSITSTSTKIVRSGEKR